MRDDPFRQTEIEQDHFAARRQLQVLRLDVPVDDRRFLRVQVFERVEQLVGPTQNLRGHKEPLALRFPVGEQLFEVLAREVLHHQKLSFADRKIIGHDRQRGVTQTIEQSGFVRKGLPQLQVVVKCLLQSYRVAKLSVRRLIDRPHSSLSQQAHDQVSALQERIWS